MFALLTVGLGDCRHAFIALALMLFAADALGAAEQALQPEKVPVLMIHGHGMHASDWRPLMSRLRKLGYPAEYLLAPQIEPNTMANVQAAETVIKPAVKKLLTASGASKIDIVAHSMGALSTRWYIAKIQPQYVRSWIALAGANHGSDVLCRYQDPGAQEVCPANADTAEQSALQVALNGNAAQPLDESPWGLGADSAAVQRIGPDSERCLAYWTLRLAVDEWIEPAASAELAGAGGVPLNLPAAFKASSAGNYVDTRRSLLGKPVADHVSLLRDAVWLQAVTRLLAADLAACRGGESR